MINNEVRVGSNVIGFRCHICGEIKGSMWGTTCNGCRATERRFQGLIRSQIPWYKKLLRQLTK